MLERVGTAIAVNPMRGCAATPAARLGDRAGLSSAHRPRAAGRDTRWLATLAADLQLVDRSATVDTRFDCVDAQLNYLTDRR